MRNETRLVYNALLSQIARLNGVAEVSKQFNVAPTIQQRLESKMQESSDFLGKINMTPVVEAQGAKLGLGVSGPVASRTNTDNADRQTRDVSTLDSKGYQCVQTNFDTHLKYQKLDAWAKFRDFQTRVALAILRRQALDRIMIGFNGTSIAATTDLATEDAEVRRAKLDAAEAAVEIRIAVDTRCGATPKCCARMNTFPATGKDAAAIITPAA